MKKKVIVIAIFAALLAMSSAYAAWSDSVSVGVSADSAIMLLQYTSRSASGSVSYDMSNGAIGSSNPYSTVEETSTHTYGNTSNTVTYTITNNGTVPIVFEGVSLSSGIVSPNWTSMINSMDVTYSYSNGINSGSVTVTDVESTSIHRFSNYQNNVLAANGGQCTMTVTYTRNSINWIIDLFISASITREDNLIYSVY